MPGPSAPTIRQPAVAGMFYPAGAAECRAQAASFLRPAQLTFPPDRRAMGALVPHAGWICSGAIAGEAIATLARQPAPDVVVVFGAVHTGPPTAYAPLDSHTHWAFPGGASSLNQQLEALLTQASSLFAFDDRYHAREHAIEVELPLIQLAFPTSTILPIAVPPTASAVDIGRQTAQIIQKSGNSAVFIASSDLTHYGPNYGFFPAGIGLSGISWAKDNDRRLLDLVRAMAAEKIVPEVQRASNACGSGAVAAMIAAVREAGAGQVALLRHASSYETLANVAPQLPDNAVGYAGAVLW